MATREIVALDAVSDLLDSPQAGDTYLAKVAAHFEAAITTDSTIDGRDIDADGTALDAAVSGLAATVIVANAALPKAGGQITGNVTCAAAETFDGRDLSVDGTKLDWLTVTQAVDLDVIEARVNALDASVVLMGTWDASAGPFPTSTQNGESWIVSVGGTVDSQIFNVGDRIVALVDSASVAVYAGNWLKLDYTDAVLTVNGYIGTVVLDADDLAEGTNLFLTAAERAKLGFLSITQAVDADALEAEAAANTAQLLLLPTAAYGCLGVEAGAAAEALVDATPRKIAAWNGNGISLLTTPDHTQDQIEIDSDGVYQLTAHLSFSGTASKTYQLEIYKNGIGTGFAVDRKLGSGGDLGAVPLVGMLALLDDDILTVYQSTSDGGSVLTITEAQFTVHRIGPTP